MFITRHRCLKNFLDQMVQQSVLPITMILLMAVVYDQFGSIPSLLIFLGFISLRRAYYKAVQKVERRKIRQLMLQPQASLAQAKTENRI